jgi:hypothetical protein
VKSEEEILATLKTLTPYRGQVVSSAYRGKTLKVSTPDLKLDRQDNHASHDKGMQRKPLGFDYPRKPLGSDNLGSTYVSDQFSNFFNAYAKTINKAYNRTGSLFQHPFGRVPITTDRQFWSVIAYIHQNPQKHGFVKDFRKWKWSSYGIIPVEKPTKLKRDTVLDWFGGKESYLELHKQWVSDAEAKWFAEDDCD